MWDFESIINKATLTYGEDVPFEIIAKYSGNILEIQENEDAIVEVLNSSFAIITLTLRNVRTVLTYPQINYVELPKELTILQNDSSFLDNYYKEKFICPLENQSLTGNGVLVSILDTGITYDHEDFKNPDGSTRIICIWDQSINGNPPRGFYQGTLYTNDDINNALINNSPLQTNDTIGHGTMVAGVCVGNGSESNGAYSGVAPNAQIMAVKLGTSSYQSFAMTTEFMRGIKFSFDVAKELNMPLVINISYGTNNGEHTGETLFEEYISNMATSYTATFVVASGNEGDAGHHYSSIIMDNEQENVNFNISGGLNSLYLSLWKNYVDDFSIELITNTNESTGKVFMSNNIEKFNFSNCNVSILYNPPTPYRLSQEVYFKIDFNNYTESITTWQLNIFGEKIVDGRFKIWLPTTEEVTKLTTFLNPTRETTLTIPATAQNVITVGGYDTTTNTINEFSGKGFNANELIKPDIVAPGNDIITTNNLLSYDIVSGTSFSAPFVSGAAAILMEYGIVNRNEIFLYGQKLKANLQKYAKRNPETVYPNRNFGYGTLCLKDTLDALIKYNEQTNN